MDVVLAGPDPELTLARLGDSPYFTALRLGTDDLERGTRADTLRAQREQSASFSSLEDFLREVRIRLRVSPLDEDNVERVVQLLQKSNQFNLTTRRHGRADLHALQERGASVWAFAYEDSFGSQGIISVVVLVPEDGALRIDSWVMSCRVLNRTVEAAVFAHVLAQAGDRRVIGELIPTEKNALVKGHYQALGFRLASRREDPPGEVWVYERSAAGTPPSHYVCLIQEEEARDTL
jgi:FkbH-like protein